VKCAALLADGSPRWTAALELGARGPYAVQASISAVHARALRHEDTDWQEILALVRSRSKRCSTTPVGGAQPRGRLAMAMARGPQGRTFDALERHAPAARGQSPVFTPRARNLLLAARAQRRSPRRRIAPRWRG